MNEALPRLLHLLLPLLSLLHAAAPSAKSDDCKTRFLSRPTAPPHLAFNVSEVAREIILGAGRERHQASEAARDLLSSDLDAYALIVGRPAEKLLAFNLSGRLRVFPNRTAETAAFWQSHDAAAGSGWTRPFKDCHFLRGEWFYGYVERWRNASVALFFKLRPDQCDDALEEIFGGRHGCDRETQHCVPEPGYGERRGGYRCLCLDGFYYPAANYTWTGVPGEDIESGLIDSPRCQACPPECDVCDSNGVCSAKRDVYLKTAILSIHLGCMFIVVIVGLVVFRQRKTKAIASSMWTILETILLGIFLLYSTVAARFFEPSVAQCLVETWTRELGFVVCYGAVVLKLYRHLIEFRTRKAHRWVVKDTDLLKYLLIMTLSVLVYLASYTAAALNFAREGFSLLRHGRTRDGLHFEACKPLWWDYVTECGELVVLLFGIHLSYASRNARIQYQERNYLCAAISIELAVSAVFYVARVAVLPSLHPDTVLVAHCLRTQLSASLTLILVFIPKFWYQQKQVRSLAQEYSCRIPVDAFKDVNAHGPLTSNNSDVDVGEVTLADMSPDDIRAELKRLYLQLEIFKSKTICRDNPHISKRRGGRKAQHRRFSLQNLHGGKHRMQKQVQEQEVTEAEPSRTPEDSVCSNEGPSAIYADLPSTTHSSDPK